jgi:hypothetical protein
MLKVFEKINTFGEETRSNISKREDTLSCQMNVLYLFPTLASVNLAYSSGLFCTVN